MFFRKEKILKEIHQKESSKFYISNKFLKLFNKIN